MPNAIRYVVGDATRPEGPGPKIIAHVCNDAGRWGAGFSGAVTRRFGRAPCEQYRDWFWTGSTFALGEVQLVEVRPALWVANMIGQHGVGRGGPDGPPVRYEAIGQALSKVAGHAQRLEASVHMPRIGAGLAGGRWEQIEPLILHALVERGVEVTVYDLGDP